MVRPLTEKPEVDLTEPRQKVLYAMQDRIAAVPPAILELLEEESADDASGDEAAEDTSDAEAADASDTSDATDEPPAEDPSAATDGGAG